MMVYRIVTSCDVKNCVGLSTQEWPVDVGFQPPWAQLPDGWTRLEGGHMACPRHTVKIIAIIDGKHHV